MKLNLLSRFYAALSRVVTDVENEAYYNEVHETSEFAFWLVFGVAMTIAVVTMYVTIPVRRLLRPRM